MRHFSMILRGEVPPVSRFRSPASLWSEMATYQIWRETVKTRGGYPRTCVFPLFRSFSEMPLFHFYIFVAFYSLSVKLSRLLVWSMVYNSANGEGHTMKVIGL